MSKRSNVVAFPQHRAWQAAKQGRLMAGWPISSMPVDVDLRRDLPALRARSREEAQNNDHVRSFLRALKVNVVGPRGARLMSKLMTPQGAPNLEARRIVEAKWARWGKLGNCDVTGERTWVDEQQLAVETVGRDGEALYRKVYGWEHNSVRFALQAIDAEALDVGMNGRLDNGNAVVMGVELNEFRRPLRYWLKRDDPAAQVSSYYVSDKDRIGIPADEIIHLKLPEWVWQTRGVPWTATSLSNLHRVKEYSNAALVAAQAGASKMGFYQQDEEAEPIVGEDGQLVTGGIGTGEDADGELVDEFEPGSIPVLPPGYSFNGWDPAFPNTDHGPFIKWSLRSVASGLGVSYNALANDLEGVNYSSLREGNLRERDIYMMLQEWFIAHFNQVVFDAWAEQALAIGELRGGALSLERLDEICDCKWAPKRWKWVDPDKETKGAEREWNMKTRSLSSIIQERGDDPDEVWEEIAADEKRMEALGIKVTPAAPPVPPASDDKPDDDEDDEDND